MSISQRKRQRRKSRRRGGLIRFIWEDIQSLSLAMNIAGSVFGIALIVGAWCLGAEWWTRRVNVAPWYVQPRMRPRLEYFGVILGLVFLCYIAYVIDRYRKSH